MFLKDLYMKFSNKNITELSLTEMLVINAGDPGLDTPHGYDVGWIIGRVFRGIADGISGKYVGMDVVVLG